MGYHPRIETTNVANLTTIRSRNSELWLVNNERLEEAILGYLAKYAKRHQVTLYGFAIEGNHLQGAMLYPEGNRADFQRDLNSSVARAVQRHVPEYPGGRFWGRRYSAEFLPEEGDIEDKFFYVALQPVLDGLVDKISEYEGYNCFHDAVCGISRTFEVVNWTAYNNVKRTNSGTNIRDFIERVELQYERLPGYEELSPAEYRKMMYRKLEERRQEILRQRNKPAAGVVALSEARPGSRPFQTKTSTSTSHRPRVLAQDSGIRRDAYAWYFEIYFEYKDASQRYRRGELDVPFPPGTYKPPLFTVRYTAPPFRLAA